MAEEILRARERRETSEWDNVSLRRQLHGRRFKGMSVDDFLGGGFMEDDMDSEVCYASNI